MLDLNSKLKLVNFNPQFHDVTILDPGHLSRARSELSRAPAIYHKHNGRDTRDQCRSWLLTQLSHKIWPYNKIKPTVAFEKI